MILKNIIKSLLRNRILTSIIKNENHTYLYKFSSQNKYNYNDDDQIQIIKGNNNISSNKNVKFSDMQQNDYQDQNQYRQKQKSSQKNYQNYNNNYSNNSYSSNNRTVYQINHKYRNIKLAKNRSKYQKIQKIIGNIDSQYWKKTLPLLQQPAQIIIKSLLNKNYNKNQIVRDLNLYLQFRNRTFSLQSRTDIGVLGVLVALNQSPHQINIQQYEIRIVDFIILTDLKEYNKNINSQMIHLFIIMCNKRIYLNLQKNLRQYYRLKYIQLVKQNFNKLQYKSIKLILENINQSLIKDQFNSITKLRYFTLVEMVSLKITAIFKAYNNNVKNDQRNYNYDTQMQIKNNFLNNQFINLYIDMLDQYNHVQQQAAKQLCVFLINQSEKQLSNMNNQFHRLYSNAISKLPYIQISLQTHQNNKNTNKNSIRSILYQHIHQLYSKNQIISRKYNKQESNNSNVPTVYLYKKFTVQKLIEQAFYLTYRGLNFKNITINNDDSTQNIFRVLHKQSLKRPELNNLLKQQIQKNTIVLLQKTILNDVLLNFYKELLNENNVDINNNNSNNIRDSHLSTKTIIYHDNQTNYRLWKVLDNLKLSYKKQQIICQRHVDILIDNQIILQMDGQNHYSIMNNQPTTAACFRNLHLLLNGYKLVIINIYEYNFNRSTEMLQELVRKKLELIKEEGVVFVE